MSLARSASGPAGLSINTAAANSLSGASSQTPRSSSLFGSSSTPTNAATTTTTTTTTGTATGGMASAGGLFGGAQKTGLFGASTTGATNTATNTTATTGGGLFGNTNNAQATTATTGGGLFGNNANNQQKPAGGSLFGNTGTANTAQAAAGTSLFGNTNQNQQQSSTATGGGLFGNAGTTNTAQPSTGTSLFGGSTLGSNTQSNTGGSGLFGQSQAKPSGTLFGQAQPQQNTTLGQSTTQVPAVQINYDSIRPRTRFDDLAKPVQDEIALLDKGIQRVIKMKDEIGEFMPQHERDIEQLGKDVHFVESKFKAVQVALNNDIQTVKILQDMTKKNIADAQLSFKATDNLKLPTHYHQTGLFASSTPPSDSNAADASSTHAHAQDLITYFNRICDDIEKYKNRLDEYRSAIERDMPGVENGLYEQIRTLRDRSNGNPVVQDQLGEVLAALRETGNAIVAQAGQIADTRERLSRLQAGIVDSGVYAMGMAA